MRKKHFIIFLLLLLGLNQSSKADIPAAFADIGYGARPVGMGGAYVALASDAYAPIWNPACLPYALGWQVSTMYAKQFGIVPYLLGTATKSVNGEWGAGFAFLSSGDDVLRENTFYFSGGMRLHRLHPMLKQLSAGLTFKFRTSSFGNNADGGVDRIQGSASGYAIDLGLRYKVSQRWTMGALFRDCMNSMNYNNETLDSKYDESVPSTMLLGVAYLAHENVIFTLDWDVAQYGDVKDKVLMGGEWKIFNMIYLRGGVSQNMDIDPYRKINFGAGVQYFTKSMGFRFDFAYQSYFLATTPRVSTSIWF